MKKKSIIISGVVFLLVIGALIIFFLFSNKKFSLESKYYGVSEIIAIDINDLSNLIASQESFALFVSQEMCITSTNFASVLNEFLEENPITIYEISFSELSTSELGNFLEYYPSFVLYKEGEVIDYLDANANEDIEYYQTSAGFKNWFTTYVNLDEINEDKITNENTNYSDDDTSNNIEEETTTAEQEQTSSEELSPNLDNITKEEGKVNIYFFWREGCPHCEEEFAFLDTINEEYGEFYNLYTFETGSNMANRELLYTFADVLNQHVNGVPFTVIGEKSFIGFSEIMESDFINAITEAKDQKFDVYFDKINLS